MVCKRGPVVVLVVPKALRCHAHALPCDLSDDCLHHDFVRRDVECLDLDLNLIRDRLCHHLGSRVLVLLVL